MTSPNYESDSAGERASTTADEIEGSSSRRSTTTTEEEEEEDDHDRGEENSTAADSTTDTDEEEGEEETTADFLKSLTPKAGGRKKYTTNGGMMLAANKNSNLMNIQSDTETKNLLEDVGEDFDEDYLNLQETELELDPKMFELSDDQLQYYTNCFLYLLEKTQGFASLHGAVQGTDRTVLEFFRKSRLDDMALSRIWSLSDVNEDGFLNCAEFIVCMHLIVLHTKANVPIPAQLPASACPSQTPTRSLVRFEDGTVGAFPQPQKLNASQQQPDSTSDSSAKLVISECISSSSASGTAVGHQHQLLSGSSTTKQHAAANLQAGSSNDAKSAAAAAAIFIPDIGASAAKPHSFSDDHLHSSSSQGAIAKFSDVPPLLVDSKPTALNVTSSQVLPEFAQQLLASTVRGPPPQPPHRNYHHQHNSGNGNGQKLHGRSASLDLKTFSALCTTMLNKDYKSVEEPASAVAILSAFEQRREQQQHQQHYLLDRSVQTTTALGTSSPSAAQTTGTQTISNDDYEEDNFAMYIRDMDTTSKLSPKQRCQMLQRINEQLEMERGTLVQVRLQLQLRIDEAEDELKRHATIASGGGPTTGTTGSSGNSSGGGNRNGSKPTTL